MTRSVSLDPIFEIIPAYSGGLDPAHERKNSLQTFNEKPGFDVKPLNRVEIMSGTLEFISHWHRFRYSFSQKLNISQSDWFHLVNKLFFCGFLGFSSTASSLLFIREGN